MAVVSFEDYIPPPRFDAVPWTKVRIQESAASTGTFVTIQTITLSPVDPDPANPLARSFTTELATLTEGWYRTIFEDATGDLSSPSSPVQNIASSLSQVQPTVRELGAVMRARTVDTNSVEQGTFTTTTRPTATQAEEMIDRATDLILIRTGSDIPSRLRSITRTVILLKAAQLVELSYYPEQTDSEQSAFAQYAAEFVASMTALEESLRENEAGGRLTPRFGTIAAIGVDGYITTPLPPDAVLP